MFTGTVIRSTMSTVPPGGSQKLEGKPERTCPLQVDRIGHVPVIGHRMPDVHGCAGVRGPRPRRADGDRIEPVNGDIRPVGLDCGSGRTGSVIEENEIGDVRSGRRSGRGDAGKQDKEGPCEQSWKDRKDPQPLASAWNPPAGHDLFRTTSLLTRVFPWLLHPNVEVHIET